MTGYKLIFNNLHRIIGNNYWGNNQLKRQMDDDGKIMSFNYNMDYGNS